MEYLKYDEAHPSLLFETPPGWVYMEEDALGICALRFAGSATEANRRPGLYLEDAARQLSEYFARQRRRFDVPLSPRGTDFQRAVWAALLDIPCGETRSYRQIAEAVGNANAARAVGMACQRNPILILIPCHRVVGSDGRLTGYAGGLERKRFLLDLEVKG